MLEEEKNKMDYNDLIISYLSGNATKEEIELLVGWINHSEINKNEFSRSRMAWLASAQNQTGTVEELVTALERLDRKIKARKIAGRGRADSNLHRIFRIAAGFLLVFLMGSLAAFLIMKSNIKGFTADVEDSLIYVYAPKGSKARTILQDGITPSPMS